MSRAFRYMMQQMDNPTQAVNPETFPQVTVNGQSVDVFFKSSDIIRLKKLHGYDIEDIKKVAAEGSAATIEMLLALFEAGTYQRLGKTAEELGNIFTPRQLFEDIQPALTEAIKKAFPQKADMPEVPPTIQ